MKFHRSHSFKHSSCSNKSTWRETHLDPGCLYFIESIFYDTSTCMLSSLAGLFRTTDTITSISRAYWLWRRERTTTMGCERP